MATSRARNGALAEINVTPMADIMIVLLIIFMVITPILGDDRVALPRAAHDEEREDARHTLVVTLRADRTIRLGDELVSSPDHLADRIEARIAESPEAARRLYLRADERLPYADVVAVMDRCRRAGIDEVALMTNPQKGV